MLFKQEILALQLSPFITLSEGLKIIDNEKVVILQGYIYEEKNLHNFYFQGGFWWMFYTRQDFWLQDQGNLCLNKK